MVTISLLSSNNFNVERHAYCLCLHVRPATIFVAVINLSGSLLCALLTFFFMVNSDLSGGASASKSNYFAARFVRDDMNRINLISVLMYLLLALVSAMLLYGVIKSKPRYILPFFGIQCIDYLFTWPQFFASITHPYHYYVAKSKTMMDDGGIGGAGGKSTNLDDMRNVWSSHSHVYTTSLLILTLIMIFKTYFLCVVWKCHRYLHMKELILPITLSAGNLNDENGILPCILRSENARTVAVAAGVPPPNYEEATKLPDYKPPEYTTVIGEPNSQATNISTNNNENSFTTVALDSPIAAPPTETRIKNA